MKGHLDGDVLAEYRAWLITGRRRRAVTAHLAGCAECAALDARLAQVSALLAAAPVPAMPDAVARRLDEALATEVQRPISTERQAVPPRQRRFRSLAGGFRVRVRVLAPVAAAVAVLAGGGYILSQVGGNSPSSGAASAAGGSARSEFGTASGNAEASGNAGAPLGPQRNSEAIENSGVYVVTSNVAYTAATLKAQVAAQLRARASLRAAPATSAESACVLGITGNTIPLLAEKARYAGTPATIIVVPRSGSDEVWVAGPNCTATNGDTLAHVVLSPGISAP